MELSKFLGRALGIYLIIVSIAFFMNMQLYKIILHSFVNDTPLMFITGFFTVILGILMVLSHNIWQWHWRLIITILSWNILLKGISILLFPGYMNKLTLLFTPNNNFAYAAISIDFILGLLLLYFGFKSKMSNVMA